MADQALREAAREFFTRSSGWRAWLDPVDARAGVRDYDLDLPSGADFLRMDKLTRNGMELNTAAAGWMQSDPAAGEQPDGAASISERLTVILPISPGEGDKIQVYAILVPSQNASGIPDHLANHPQVARGILAGARYHLRTTPGAAYENTALAAIDMAEANGQADTFSVAAWRGFTNQTPRLRPTWC